MDGIKLKIFLVLMLIKIINGISTNECVNEQLVKLDNSNYNILLKSIFKEFAKTGKDFVHNHELNLEQVLNHTDTISSIGKMSFFKDALKSLLQNVRSNCTTCLECFRNLEFLDSSVNNFFFNYDYYLYTLNSTEQLKMEEFESTYHFDEIRYNYTEYFESLSAYAFNEYKNYLFRMEKHGTAKDKDQLGWIDTWNKLNLKQKISTMEKMIFEVFMFIYKPANAK